VRQPFSTCRKKAARDNQFLECTVYITIPNSGLMVACRWWQKERAKPEREAARVETETDARRDFLPAGLGDGMARCADRQLELRVDDFW
jgi:hypothetical protein